MLLVEEELGIDEHLSDDEINQLVAQMPDFTKYDVAKAFLKDYWECCYSINKEINELACGAINEKRRIESALWWKAEYGEKDAYEDRDYYQEFLQSCKEPTVEELMLSMAFIDCSGSKSLLISGELHNAFSYIASANLWLGKYVGCKDTTEKSVIFKQAIQEKAESIRHGENRAMKAEAIQYYKDNREVLGSKDNASYEMAKKIVPSKPSTIRGWLKNV